MSGSQANGLKLLFQEAKFNLLTDRYFKCNFDGKTFSNFEEVPIGELEDFILKVKYPPKKEIFGIALYSDISPFPFNKLTPIASNVKLQRFLLNTKSNEISPNIEGEFCIDFHSRKVYKGNKAINPLSNQETALKLPEEIISNNGKYIYNQKGRFARWENGIWYVYDFNTAKISKHEFRPGWVQYASFINENTIIFSYTQNPKSIRNLYCLKLNENSIGRISTSLKNSELVLIKIISEPK